MRKTLAMSLAREYIRPHTKYIPCDMVDEGHWTFWHLQIDYQYTEDI